MRLTASRNTRRRSSTIVIDVQADGSFRMNMDYFDYCTGLRMTNGKFDALFGGPPRNAEELLTQREMDLAASIQAVTEEIVLRLTRALAAKTGQKISASPAASRSTAWRTARCCATASSMQIWIQPAAGDAGGAVGAALATYYLATGAARPNGTSDTMRGSYLGPAYSDEDIAARLRSIGARFDVLTEDRLIQETSRALAAGEAVGWFQGRMEFGPRALGARSILGDPRSPTMQKMLNLKVKYRESFRPFAPAVLREHVADWFELDCDSPYMLLVAGVRPERRRAMTEDEKKLWGIDQLNVVRSDIPAVTHVDYSARIQTVHAETNARFHQLLTEFNKLTGCPVLVNTSFNVRGEPIVCTPEDAFRCFMGTDIEVLAIGDCLLRKCDQDPKLKENYEQKFELD